MRAVRAHLAGPRLLKRRACVEPHTFHLAVPWESPHFYLRTSVLLRRYKVHVLPTRVPTCQLTLKKKNLILLPTKGASTPSLPACAEGLASEHNPGARHTCDARACPCRRMRPKGEVTSVACSIFLLWGKMARGVYKYFLFFCALGVPKKFFFSRADGRVARYLHFKKQQQ